MSKEIKYSRLLIKRTDIPGVSATTTTSTDHTSLPAWEATDIYVGEQFLNTTDNKLWIRTTNNVKEIALFDSVNISSPSNDQVLTYSDGVWVNKTPVGVTYSMSPLVMSTPSMMSTSMVDGVNGGLSDVNVVDPVDDQFLVYEKNKWVNKTKLDKIIGMSWDKSETALLVDTEDGTHKLSLNGKPIHTITGDVLIDNTYHTLIVDASEQDIDIVLPTAQNSYGEILIFRFINYTHDITIFAGESDFIFIDEPMSNLTINDNYSNHKNIMLHCDGNSTWYSI